MNKLGIFIKPYKNELTFSWLQRLAKANGISFRNFSENYLGKSMLFEGDFSYDIRHELNELSKSLMEPVDLNEIYINNSGQAFVSLFQTESNAKRYAMSFAKAPSNLNPALKSFISGIKVCPECLEAMDTAYVHVEHQLPGVTICPIHRRFLKKYVGKKGSEFELFKGDYEDVEARVNYECDLAYSEYVSDLLWISSDIGKVKAVLASRLKEMGYLSTWEDTGALLRDFGEWKYSSLLKEVGYVVKKIFPRNINSSPESIVPLLMFAFPEASSFTNALELSKPYFIKGLCNRCGETAFLFSESSDERLCCRCSSETDEKKEFIYLVKKKGNGEYEPLEPFVSMNQSVLFLHKPCGKKTLFKPRSFLYGTSTCSCEKIAFEKGFEMLEKYKNEYGNANVKKSCIYEGYGLGSWCASTRRKMRNNVLSDSQMHQLKALGFEEDVKRKKWEEKLSLYKSYVEDNGSAHVESGTVYNGVKLGDWYKNLKRSFNKGSLSERAVDEIRAINPSFPDVPPKEPKKVKEPSYHQVRFEEALELLLSYAEEKGTLSIPKRASYKGYNLGAWANQMRSKKKQGVLPKGQIERLNEIGFDWDPLRTKWYSDLERYGRYVNGTGKTNIPKGVEFEGFKIGNWYSNLKASYRNGSLTEEQIGQIREANPGFMKEFEEQD